MVVTDQQTQRYFNMLTTNCEYSRSNVENLPLSIQLQLSEKIKTTFCSNFISFFESPLNFEHFEKKYGPYSLSISQIIDSEKRDT